MFSLCHCGAALINHRADLSLAPRQWETSLQSNAVSHWLGANLESQVLWTHEHQGTTQLMIFYDLPGLRDVLSHIEAWPLYIVILVTDDLAPNRWQAMNIYCTDLSMTSPQCGYHINSLAPGKFEWNFRYVIFKRILVFMVEASLVKYECHWTSLMISQYCFRLWLGTVGQQAITWANVDPDLCRLMVSRGQNEFNQIVEHNITQHPVSKCLEISELVSSIVIVEFIFSLWQCFMPLCNASPVCHTVTGGCWFKARSLSVVLMSDWLGNQALCAFYVCPMYWWHSLPQVPRSPFY